MMYISQLVCSSMTTVVTGETSSSYTQNNNSLLFFVQKNKYIVKGLVRNKKLISRCDRRTLPPEPRHR